MDFCALFLGMPGKKQASPDKGNNCKDYTGSDVLLPKISQKIYEFKASKTLNQDIV